MLLIKTCFTLYLFEISTCFAYSKTKLQVLILSPLSDSFPFSSNQLKPVSKLAKEEIEKEGILPYHELKFVYVDSHCDPKIGEVAIIMHLIDKCDDDGWSAIFGPICSYNLLALSRLNVKIWNNPIITIGAFAQNFRTRNIDMDDYLSSDLKFITATGYNYQNPSDLIVKVCQQYEWKNAIFISPFNQFDFYYDFRHCRLFYASLENSVITHRESGGLLHIEYIQFKVSTPKESARYIFNETYKDNSIFIFCIDPKLLQSILTILHEWNFNNGQYVFINVDIFNDIESLKKPWENSDLRPEILKTMYRYVLTVTLKPLSEDFNDFSMRVKNYSSSNTTVNNFGAAFYDSIMLYSKTIKNLLNNSMDINNASVVSEAMKNVNFTGVSGSVNIDSYGDRNSEYILLDLNPKNGKFEEVAVYSGITGIFSLKQGVAIDWGNPGNRVPSDSQTCAYDNDKCKVSQNIHAYVAIGVFVLLLNFSLVAVIYRHVKFQAELNGMNWLISMSELETFEERCRRKSKIDSNSRPLSPKLLNKKKKQNVISRSRNSIRDFMLENLKGTKFAYSESKSSSFVDDVEFLQSNLSIESIGEAYLNNMESCKLFGFTAWYKGTIVALKIIKKEKKIEITKDLLLEVKKMKDMNNTHTCRLIGACLEWPFQYIVYEYCSKGSLKDILAQKQLILDWLFKYSLIQDICRGMIYIHHNFGPHGNLKSSNCVVDSRFVLKITDFGLPTLQGTDRTEILRKMDDEYYSALLWVAPERLRTNTISGNATFKSDIYSFAIICQEIIFRKGHFYIEGQEKLSNFEKFEQVEKVLPIPFRPSLYAAEGCTEYLLKIVENSWNENPSLRPDFETIKSEMRKFNRSGDSRNLLDNILSRMEQYAKNLEGLVNERTEQYLEEKRKAETLLYSMLPRSVAHQLIRKENVVAESYEMVTVYFSDIVGFTPLSAESTAMQIVTLLNKLYTTFDRIIERFDVYKVETIGDAYVVCSGLPTPNGNNHAREISRMSIAFINEMFTFVIPHRPERQLKLRIGIHSGPVCAGVVGLIMPRYCLFGDTVNTSSRMESSGLPLKIHISESTKDILCTFDSFLISERGYVEMKGKGLQLTFWLHGEGDTIVDPIPADTILIPNLKQT